MQNLSGQKLGQYELRERLGRGGMAEVYKAYQPGMDRFVAIKVMLGHLATDESFVERFRREAQAVGRLRHPHLVQIFDFGIEGDVYFMAMEFIQGGTLKETIQQDGKLHPEYALRITSQLADALAYAHENDMVHRDLKPANVMFTDVQRQNAVLTDFGIARILNQSGLTGTGMAVGTPDYMSPEMARGENIDHRADLYALGIILYEMLTGEAPYSADTPMAVIFKHMQAPLPTRNDYGDNIPEPIERVILKAMAKDPGARYQSAVEMKQAVDNALRELAQGVATAAPTALNSPTKLESAHDAITTTSEPTSASGGLPWLWIGVAAIAVILVIAALLLTNNTPVDPEPTAEIAVATDEATEETASPTDAPEATAEPAAEDDSLRFGGVLPPHPDNLNLLEGFSEISDEVDQSLVVRDLETAREMVGQALEEDPDDIGALYASAHVNLELYNIEEAEAAAQRIIELAPDDPMGYLALFDVYTGSGRWDEAVEIIATAAELDPENPHVLWRQARVAEWDEENEILSRAEESGASGYRFIRYAGFYFADALQLERALPYLDTALQASGGGDYEVRAYLMGTLVLLGRAEDALPLAQENAPGQTDATTLGEMAFIAWKAGDTAQAREWAERARALSSEAYEASWVLAWIIAEEDGDIDTALEMLELIEPTVDNEFYPRYMNPLFGYALPLDRARLLVQAGRFEEALEVYNRVLENEPYEAQWYVERGDVLVELGDTEAARADYRVAADIALETGDDELAEAMLQRITELGPAAGEDE